MIEAIAALLGSLAVGNMIYDKLTIRSLRQKSDYLLASLLEVSQEKRAAATIRTGSPTVRPGEPGAGEVPESLSRPQQVGLGRRP